MLMATALFPTARSKTQASDSGNTRRRSSAAENTRRSSSSGCARRSSASDGARRSSSASEHSFTMGNCQSNAVCSDNFITLIRNQRSKNKFKELLAGLMHNRGDVDATAENGMTALHFAVLQGDEPCTRALIAFGADINAMNDFDMTPLDIAIQNRQEALVPLLVSVGCERGEQLEKEGVEPDCSLLSSIELVFDSPVVGGVKEPRRRSAKPVSLTTNAQAQKTTQTLKHELQDHMERRFELSATVSPDEAFAMAIQQQEISRLSPKLSVQQDDIELPSSLEFRMEGGSRILTLDGGGIRGLVQIEILSEIERLTGRKITDLFDWIIGTSTGGILALGLVYCGKSLAQLRQLYFRLKEQVFSRSRMGYAYNSKALEELLKEELGTELRMCDVNYPKVLITAVEKKTTQPKLHFFNNCFGDELSTQPIWKVARYTSAAPMCFTECDNYVDGGVLANNPSESALAAIQKFYREKGCKLPIACVVSVGSGKDPSRDLGSVDALSLGLMRMHDMFRRVQNLVELLTRALVESEAVAERCRCSCAEQGIPFYRFSPQLDKKVDSGETDNLKLLHMMITAKIYTNGDACAQMDKLIPQLITSSRSQ